ncbi:hypothetical protein [Streptomyces sp. S465]|uniref:hypothetical protein n=1 Tax=Streptomyces sp. S465 TaxID=2979468 RepID=UPI0022A821EE|nr:hypothetical protein [Streptomyces sp. S465]WAP55731.1 hypothetical protein N6H00_12485 [Streptomyces sp. S465]
MITSSRLTTDGWVFVAAVTTVIYMVAMRWCMPTPKAQRRTFLAPLAGCVFLVPSAAVKGYSVSFTLYLYSCGLLMMVIMLAPVRKRVAADIAEQEQKPWTKVPLNTFSLYWLTASATGCIAAMVLLWPHVG